VQPETQHILNTAVQIVPEINFEKQAPLPSSLDFSFLDELPVPSPSSLDFSVLEECLFEGDYLAFSSL
jgi:hypothetical protein